MTETVRIVPVPRKWAAIKVPSRVCQHLTVGIAATARRANGPVGAGRRSRSTVTDLVEHNCPMADPSETTAFVTGASRGIGRLISVALADDGARVVGFARPSDELDSLRDERGSIVPIATDVTRPESVRASFARAVDEVGHPTLLVTCAGSIDALGPIVLVDPDRWWDAVAVDLRGTMLCAQAAARSMIEQRTGRIVTVYGNLGDEGAPNVSAFAAAKAATARLTETLATELSGTGVVALCLHPGFVRTPMTEALASSIEGRRWLPEFGEQARMRWGDGRSAVDLVRRIIDGDADHWSGRVIHVGDDLADPSGPADGRRRLRLDLAGD